MIQMWWALLRFLRVIFVPPKFTELEEYLTRQVAHLESELNRERERYLELADKVMFPAVISPIEPPHGPHTIEPQVSKENAERKRLSDLSKQRWHDHIQRQEARAAELMQLDDARAKEARNEKASGQPS